MHREALGLESGLSAACLMLCACTALAQEVASGDVIGAARIVVDGHYNNSLGTFRGGVAGREREVLPRVVGGLLNKQATAHLAISEVTLQIHRTNVMRKMEADSLGDLVRMAGSLNIPVSHNRHA